MSTLRHPSFRGHVRVEPAGPDSVLLVAEDDVIHLHGRPYRILAPLLDGRRTVDELIEQVDGELSAAEVHYALGRLESKGYLIEAEPKAPVRAAAYWHALGVEHRHVVARLREETVALRSLGDIPLKPIREALRAEGLRVVETGGASLTLVLTDDYLHEPLAAWNEEALRTGRPWLLARPLGQVTWLGPRFTPGKTACWECLAQRLRIQRPVEAFLRREQPGAALLRPARAALEGTLRAAAHLLATTVARGLVTGEEDGLADVLVTLDTVALRTERHTVVRRPQCPACGEPRLMASHQERPLVLESRRKAFTADGGHRLQAPEETLRRFQHHVSPITGVLPHLERLESPGGELAPVIDAGPSPSRPVESLGLLSLTFRARNGGKGRTEVQARTSGLCEALERYSGVFRGEEARRHGTLHALRGEAIHPHLCLNYSEAQYREREALGALPPPYRQRVPHPFDPELAIDWSPAWSLTHGARRWLPTAFCYYGFQDAGVPRFCQADSNGCAAGNSLEEAILQGFLELVERDAVALWWYNRLRRPRVDLASFDEPYFERLTGLYRQLGRELWVLDITSDLGIPVFAAVSRRREGHPEALLLGFGAHLEPRIGILRAITEVNQFLPFEPDTSPVGPDTTDVMRWLKTATLAEHPYLQPGEAWPAVTASRYGRLWGEDLRDDVETCVRIAREHGMETLVVDQTRPDVGLAVARVVVPGMRHFWRRLGPGRLYDVPVRAGWLERPTPEAGLNPLEVFF